MQILGFDLDTPIQTLEDIERIYLELERTDVAGDCFNAEDLPSRRPDLGGLLILDRLYDDAKSEKIIRNWRTKEVFVWHGATLGRITPRDLAMLIYLRWSFDEDEGFVLAC